MLMYPTYLPGRINSNISANGLSRMMTAAVVNQKFRDLLLSNPAAAMSRGYLGEKFSLDSDEMDLVLSIQATSLSDFAQQLLQISTDSKKKSGMGNSKGIPRNFSYLPIQLGSLGND
jgi:hypothetical protein